MTSARLKHLRSKSSYSQIAYNTFVSEGAYSAEMLKNDLLKAGIQITEIRLDEHEKTCEFFCVFHGQPFSVGIEEYRSEAASSRIMFEADLLLMRNLMDALCINEEECR